MVALVKKETKPDTRKLARQHKLQLRPGGYGQGQVGLPYVLAGEVMQKTQETPKKKTALPDRLPDGPFKRRRVMESPASSNQGQQMSKNELG